MSKLDLLKENVFSVSQFLEFISDVLEPLAGVKVQGEIQQVSNHATGIYITLKDATGKDGVITVYAPPFMSGRLPFVLEEGMEVLVTGAPAFFKRKGGFYLRLMDIELAGAGAIKKQYELLKAKLEAEGLFNRKRSLPEFISSVGVITSLTGAVIDDFKKNLAQVHIKVYMMNARVEGAVAEESILQAINFFKTFKPGIDCLVLIRGGGSKDDLAVFNSEVLCRALFSSPVPTVVSIGHDRDVPLVQMVGDIAVSTPTAAAFAINESWQQIEQLDSLKQTLSQKFNNKIIHLLHELELSKRVIAGSYNKFETKLASLKQRLTDLNPENILKKGYSLVWSGDRLVKDSKSVKTDLEIEVQFRDGLLNGKLYGKK